MKDGKLTEDGKVYENVKRALIERYEDRKDPGAIMQEALNAILNLYLIETSLDKLEELYEETNFNEKAKFVMLQKAVNKISDLAAMALLRCPSNFDKLVKIIEDFHHGRQAYPSLDRRSPPPLAKEEQAVAQTEAHRRLLVRPNARVTSVEHKVDDVGCKVDHLAEDMKNLTLMMKKGRHDKGRKPDNRSAGQRAASAQGGLRGHQKR